ncbi:MAG: hypothetical protein HY917_03750 [Candidatus Diapherotrites archaeon]|nr:hypothetical protein [Candidatus Diapherotrites archaeon]
MNSDDKDRPAKLAQKELEFKEKIRSVLDNVGYAIPYDHTQEIYDELVRASKKIYGKDHDLFWQRNKERINTYLLIGIFGMFKKNLEQPRINTHKK